MWAAVLNDAMFALNGHHPQGRRNGSGVLTEAGGTSPERLWQEALLWVLADVEEPLGTFQSVCGALGVSADAVRRSLVVMAERTAPRLGARPLEYAIRQIECRLARAA